MFSLFNRSMLFIIFSMLLAHMYGVLLGFAVICNIPGLIVLSIFQFEYGYKKQLEKNSKGIRIKSLLSVVFSVIIAVSYGLFFSSLGEATHWFVGFTVIFGVPYNFIFSWIILEIVHRAAMELRKKKAMKKK